VTLEQATLVTIESSCSGVCWSMHTIYLCFSERLNLPRMMVKGVAPMHQSRKEQGIERSTHKLLQSERREAMLLAVLEEGIEDGAEWSSYEASAHSHDVPGGRA